MRVAFAAQLRTFVKATKNRSSFDNGGADINKYTLRQTPLAAAIGTLVAGGAQAATITVTTNADGPLGSITGECTLRAAVAAAHQDAAVDGCASGSPGADDIVFDTSLENSTITLNIGQMQITEPLTITGPVPGDSAGLVISGNNVSRIFHVQTAEFELGSLTLAQGRTMLDYARGGAIFADDATVLLEHVLLTGNSTTGAGASGGALYARYGETTLIHSQVSGNETTGINPHYFGSDGSGLEFRGGGEATLIDTTVTANSATGRGGGISVKGADLWLINSTISDNEAGSATVTSGYGGGLHASFSTVSPAITIIGSTISGNTSASSGGGIFISNGPLTVTNSTISGNTASSVGGGVLGYFPGDIQLIHTTVANNSGSGVHRQGYMDIPNLTLRNSLILQSGGNPACSHAADSHTSSMATDDSCTGSATPAASYIEPLANNGGPTQTHALNYQNPARNAANATICANTPVNSIDQRGQPRPGEGTSECDIGAFEWQLLGDDIFEDRFEAGP